MAKLCFFLDDFPMPVSISNLFLETHFGFKNASVDVSHSKLGWEITTLRADKHRQIDTHIQTLTPK